MALELHITRDSGWFHGGGVTMAGIRANRPVGWPVLMSGELFADAMSLTGTLELCAILDECGYDMPQMVVPPRAELLETLRKHWLTKVKEGLT